LTIVSDPVTRITERTAPPVGRSSTARPQPADADQTFMLVEIVGNDLFFQAIARTGRIVDSGVIHRRPTT
jgi:hypothetical protein